MQPCGEKPIKCRNALLLRVKKVLRTLAHTMNEVDPKHLLHRTTFLFSIFLNWGNGTSASNFVTLLPNSCGSVDTFPIKALHHNKSMYAKKYAGPRWKVQVTFSHLGFLSHAQANFALLLKNTKFGLRSSQALFLGPAPTPNYGVATVPWYPPANIYWATRLTKASRR